MRVETGFPFSEHDTPQTRKRIEHDLRQIAEGVADADPSLVALVLTGGFSRGEGTVRGGKPVNDYDLVAIRSRPGGGRLYRALHKRLAERVGLEVDLMPMWRVRVPRVAPKLFWHDLRLGGKVIAGDAGVLDAMPRYQTRDIRRQEGARLLGNRAAGLLGAVPGPDAPIDEPECQLQATKAMLAALDARLLDAGHYATRMRERLDLARRLGLPDLDAYETAVEWKLSTEGFDPGPDWWTRARDVLLRAVRDTRAREASDGVAEHVYHVLASKRFRRSPSHAVRVATWDLLATTRFPEGPAEPERARALLGRLGRVGEARDWPALKRRYFELRALTLQ